MVEDDEAISDLHKEILRRSDINSEVAENFETAHNFLSNNNYDAVLLDIFLGSTDAGKDGIALLKLSQELHPDTPVIILTGQPTVDTASESVRLGAYDYLTKPVEKEKFVSTVLRAIDLKQLRDRNKQIVALNKNYQQNLERLVIEKTEELNLSENRYRNLFEHSIDPVYIVNRNGEFLDFNPSFSKLFGYDNDELNQLTIKDLFSTEEDWHDSVKILENEEALKDFSVTCLNKSNITIDCLFTSSVIRDNNNQISGFQGIIRDITEEKRTERLINEQNAFMKSVLDSFPYPFLVINTQDYSIEKLNKAAQNKQKNQSQYCYSSFYNHKVRCSKLDKQCPVEEVIKTGKNQLVQIEHHVLSGTKTLETHAFPIFDEQNEITQVFLYYYDITERINNSRELLRLSTALEQTADIVVITDNKGLIQYVNPAYEMVTGYELREVIRSLAVPFQVNQLQAETRMSLWDTILNDNVWQGNITNRKKDGTIFEEEITVSPVRDENNTIINYVAISRDITHRRQLESIAEASNLMKNYGYIFSGIRHEIGNPINSLKMALTVLIRNIATYSTEKTLNLVERSLAEVSRIEYLLKMLRNFGLYENPELEEVDICDFMERFIPLAIEDFEGKGINLKFQKPEIKIIAWTDPRALHQILLNIITNSADALVDQERAYINISLGQKKNNIVIEVADNGCGMTENEVNQLFKPFYTTKKSGTGLGMVIVKNMLAKMGGSINIHTTKDIGTTIYLFMPKFRANYE